MLCVVQWFGSDEAGRKNSGDEGLGELERG